MARKSVIAAYKESMITYLKIRYGFSDEEAKSRLSKACEGRYRPMTAVIEDDIADGMPVLKAVDLVTYLDRHSDDLISPSGSFYCQHEKKEGATVEMVQTRLKQRKKVKKKMLAAKAVEDFVTYWICYFLQTLIKIGVNALPGNYGFSSSLFYSKPNYNAITSTGRALIGYANTCIEHVLGGNFGWFNQDQLINHITIHLGTYDKDKLTQIMNRHNMRWVSTDELLNFFKKELSIYNRYADFGRVERVVRSLDSADIQFFWYYQNLRHILMDNDEVFRPWLNEMFDLKKVVFKDDVKPEDLFELDGALVTVVNVAFNDVVSSGSPDIQVYDLPKKMPDLAKKFVNIANYVQSKLDEFVDVMNLFVFTERCVPDVENRKKMIRNSSVISDTDSVIFTVKDWVDWYTHDIYKIYPETYHIACIMTYWITQAVAHALKLFSIAHGAKGKHITDMAMKNEFLYPTMCLAKIKKTYAGVVTVQEGVILSKPSTDIKGVQLKGSDICKKATEFAEKFIVNDILLGSLNQKISAHDLIQTVIGFEKKIYDETVSGSPSWCQPLSIKTKDAYKTPLSSSYFYYMAWQEIFAEKYGDIILPSKVITIPIADNPTHDYFEYLKKTSPQIGKKYQDFIAKYGKAPSKMSISPTVSKIPKELIPLVKVRSIVYDNVKPCRLILQNLGIDCGFEKDELSFTEVYGDHSLLSRNNTRTKE